MPDYFDKLTGETVQGIRFDGTNAAICGLVNIWCFEGRSGIVPVKPGEFMMRKRNGDRYQCRPAILEERYEIVDAKGLKDGD